MKSKQRRLLLLVNLFHIFGLSILAPVYALYGLKIVATPLQIGASWGLYNLLAGLTNITAGKFIDATRRSKTFIIAGYVLTIFGICLFFIVRQPSQLYLVQAVSGLGVGIYMPAWKSLYSRSTTKGQEASQWGLFDGGNMIAMAVAALLAGYLVNQNLYSLLFTIIASLYTLSTLISLKLSSN